MQTSLCRWVCLSLLMPLALPVQGAELRLAFDVQHTLVQQVLRERVFSGPGASVRVNDDGTGCQFLQLSEPRVGERGARLRVLSTAHARLGQRVGEGCVVAVDWRGQLETVHELAPSRDGRTLSARVVETNLLTVDGRADRVPSTLAAWLARAAEKRFNAPLIDLGAPLGELQQMLRTALVGMSPAPRRALLESVRLAAAEVRPQSVAAIVALRVPNAVPAVSAAEPALSAAELQRMETGLQSLDAFVTFVARHAATDTPDEQLRDALLAVLLDTRREIVRVLAQDAPGADPVRRLFVQTWDRLMPLVRRIAQNQPDTTRALDYVALLAGADALRALDTLGPGLGLEISSDGLRRLARGLMPATTRDPVEYTEGVDPALRRLFGFGAPLRSPRAALGRGWFAWVLRPAVAAEIPDLALLERLNSWAPTRREAERYLPQVNVVLRYAAENRLIESRLEPRFHPVYRRLVLAAAWQESCWRQFVAQKGKHVPLKSRSGDVGIMQVNAKVWRGFYEPHGLSWDFAYNAIAGAEVLLYYLQKYALRHREHEVTGQLDNLARSAYSAYNGGPRQYDRYRRENTAPALRQIDASFNRKYLVVSQARDVPGAVASCFSG